MNNIEFLYLALGSEKRVCIAHLKNNNLYPYAVVKNPDTNDYTWSHAIQYCKTYIQAKEVFYEYIR